MFGSAVRAILLAFLQVLTLFWDTDLEFKPNQSMASMDNSRIAHSPYDLFLSFDISVEFATSLLVLFLCNDVFIGFTFLVYFVL